MRGSSAWRWTGRPSPGDRSAQGINGAAQGGAAGGEELCHRASMAGRLLPSPGAPREETCQMAQMAGASLPEGLALPSLVNSRNIIRQTLKTLRTRKTHKTLKTPISPTYFCARTKVKREASAGAQKAT